jgi:segregation and condensation protein B
MEISQIIPHVEALIFAADRPVPLLEIVDLLNNALAFLEDRTNLDQVEAAMEAIREKYSSEFYAFEVRSSGGGYQFLTKKEYYQTVAQLNGDKFLKRLSTAALETLAIIAYRQPISKGEIEYIRGVSTDYSIQKLLEKELIVITGRSEDQPGKPLLYAVSRSFMDYFGISSVADLPKLKELFDEEMVQPTLITDDTATLGRGEHNTHTAETAHSLMVSEDGELLDPDHQLEQLEASAPEAEAPASEDEEVEPDDEIVRFDDIIEEVNEELGGGEEGEGDTNTSTAEDEEEEEDEDPYAVKDIAPRTTDEENEDPDGIVEDVISGEEEKEEEVEEEKEEDPEKEDDDDGDKDPDDMMEDAILGEKLLVVSGPGVVDDDEEEEEEEEEEDDDDDYDDEDDEDKEDDDDEKDDKSGK